MAYIPEQSIVAVQSDPTKLLTNAQLVGNSSVATLHVVDDQIVSSMVALVTDTIIHGKTTGAGGGYVEVKVDPSGALVTSLSSTVSFQSKPSSLLTGASIFGQLPAGTAVLGSVAALQSTNPWNVSGSVIAFQAGTMIVSVVGTMAGTSSVYSVRSSISTVSIMAANANRKSGMIYNAAGTTVFVKLGTAATTSIYTVSMNNNDYYELPGGWTGVVAGITTSTAGIINVTELT